MGMCWDIWGFTVVTDKKLETDIFFPAVLVVRICIVVEAVSPRSKL